MKDLDEVIQHYGVKGMKWGVIRTEAQLARARVQNGVKKASTRAKAEWSSMSRERQWKKVLDDIDKLSTKDLNRIAGRIQLENEMKRLTTTKLSKRLERSVVTKKDKQDYRDRAKMSDEELSRKVTRLKAKTNLHRTVKDASKSQRDFGKKAINIAGPLAIKYALTGSITPKDIFSVSSNPGKARSEAKKSILDQVVRKNKD